MSDDKLRKQVEKLCKPIFDKVLKEAGSNSMTIAPVILKFLWRPNNYRRKIIVKTKDNSTIKKIISAIESTHKLQYNEHNKLLFVYNFNGITLQYGKNTLTGIWSQDKKKTTYLIESDCIDGLEELIDKRKKKIQEQIDNALELFIKQFKIKLMFEKPIWDRYEDWIKGDEFIDKIPEETIVHDTIWKKVYPKGIEFKQTSDKEDPTTFMKTYIKNRAIEKISPEIANELMIIKEIEKSTLKMNESTSKTLNQFVNTTIPILQDFSINIKTHNKVLKGIDKSFLKFNRLLTEKQKRLGEWI